MVLTLVSNVVFRKTRSGFEFLLLKRLESEGGFWQGPGGKVESFDKTLLDAAKREMKEETGISQKDIIKEYENIHQFNVTTHYMTGKLIEPVPEYAFAFEVKSDVKIQLEAEEHEKYIWVSFDKALNMLKWENNKESFRRLRRILENNK